MTAPTPELRPIGDDLTDLLVDPLANAPVEGVPDDLLPHPAPFACRVGVAAHQVSPVVPHVRNVEYLRWFERGAELHCDALGHTRARMLDEGVMWFVARHEIDFRAETMLDDELVLFTWIRDLRRVKSWRDAVLWRPADETVVAHCSTLWVFVDLATRRPRTVPPPMASTFDTLEARS
ncbi:MAG: acyl-CoA thioesterase [Planctomycetota bacterium]